MSQRSYLPWTLLPSSLLCIVKSKYIKWPSKPTYKTIFRKYILSRRPMHMSAVDIRQLNAICKLCFSWCIVENRILMHIHRCSVVIWSYVIIVIARIFREIDYAVCIRISISPMLHLLLLLLLFGLLLALLNINIQCFLIAKRMVDLHLLLELLLILIFPWILILSMLFVVVILLHPAHGIVMNSLGVVIIVLCCCFVIVNIASILCVLYSLMMLFS